jgi:hypothetical protein
MALTDRQRDALARGPAARSARAHLLRCVGTGIVSLVGLLEGNETAAEETALGVRIDRLLTAAAGVGDDTAADLLQVAGVAPHKTLGSLTIQHRRALAAALRDRPREIT